MGELVLEVGAANGWGPSPLSSEQLAGVLGRLRGAAEAIGADVSVLRQRGADAAAGGQQGACCFAAVRGGVQGGVRPRGRGGGGVEAYLGDRGRCCVAGSCPRAA